MEGASETQVLPSAESAAEIHLDPDRVAGYGVYLRKLPPRSGILIKIRYSKIVSGIDVYDLEQDRHYENYNLLFETEIFEVGHMEGRNCPQYCSF